MKNTMDKKKIKNFLVEYGMYIFVLFLVIGGFVYVFFISPVPSPPDLEYEPEFISEWTDPEFNYCVEWDGFILREHLFLNCYDIVNDKLNCIYSIAENNSLLVEQIGGEKLVFECSQKVQSIHRVKNGSR